jgi:hypothetical protein
MHDFRQGRHQSRFFGMVEYGWLLVRRQKEKKPNEASLWKRCCIPCVIEHGTHLPPAQNQSSGKTLKLPPAALHFCVEKLGLSPSLWRNPLHL